MNEPASPSMELRPQIGYEEMKQALERWQDLLHLRSASLERLAARIKRGELDNDAIVAALERTHENELQATHTMAEAAGLSDDARVAFIAGTRQLLESFVQFDEPPETLIDCAAFAGLCIGLTARQLADGE
jgi:hypothetical protein